MSNLADPDPGQRASGAGEPPLRRALSLPLLTLYGLGVTLGAGIYVLVGATVGLAGPHAPVAFLLAACVVALTAFSYAELATRIMLPFVEGSLSEEDLRDLCGQAYGRFAHKAVTPLVQLDEQHWLLELFHGPTLAFKDFSNLMCSD